VVDAETHFSSLGKLIDAVGTAQPIGVEAPPPMRAPDPKMRLLCGIWVAFVLGAGTGAAMVLHFKALGMVGAALLLIVLILRNSRGAQMTETS
jgi:hypothetical protein